MATGREAMATSFAVSFQEGRDAFNRGEFFEAHEHWEDVWRELPIAERAGLQGLIQIAAGLHHLRESRPAPALKLLDKGLLKLRAPPFAPLLLALVNEDSLVALAGAIENLRGDLLRTGKSSFEPSAIRLR